MMENKVQKQIIDYFTFFEEFHNTSKTCLKVCQNCAISINKLVRRCNNIKQAYLTGTPLEHFGDLQNKLSTSLHNLISEEVHEIRTLASIIEELFEKLCNKRNILEESCKSINHSEQSLLVKGTPFQPPLKQILVFVEDTITYGNQLCIQIETSLNVLSYKGLSVDSLVENFKIFPNWQRRIPEILAYTSFSPENQI